MSSSRVPLFRAVWCLAIAVFSVTAARAAVLSEFIDQRQLSFDSGPYFTDQWQSFTAGFSNPLSAISIHGTINSESTLYIYLGEGTSGTLLWTLTVPAHKTRGWIKIVLSEPLAQLAGSQYTFRIVASGTSNNIWWNTTDPYAGGRHSYNAPSGQDLAFRTHVLPKLTKTLVVFLTKYEDSEYSDLNGAMSALDNEIVSNIERMSFHTASLELAYAGPYVGDIENCDENTNAAAAIGNHAVNRAYNDGIDVTQYENFIILRNYDFGDDDCSNSGTGGYRNNITYDGGVLAAGQTTVTRPLAFSSRTFGSGKNGWRPTHEFLHGYARGSSHSVMLECFTDPAKAANTKVPYFYVGDESPLSTPYCKRTLMSRTDAMGMAFHYVETNSQTKLQYGWLNLSNIVRVEGPGEREIALKPIDEETLVYAPQMAYIPIPGTTKAYLLELKANAYSGTGVYLYLMPNVNRLAYQEQYMLSTGELYTDGRVAPMAIGVNEFDSQMGLSVNVLSASATEARVEVKIQPNQLRNLPGDELI